MKLLSNIRFLPVTIFVAIMILTIKINNLHESFEKIGVTKINISSASAQTEPPDGQKKLGVNQPPYVHNEYSIRIH